VQDFLVVQDVDVLIDYDDILKKWIAANAAIAAFFGSPSMIFSMDT
jgi:hypothetical protein